MAHHHVQYFFTISHSRAKMPLFTFLYWRNVHTSNFNQPLHGETLWQQEIFHIPLTIGVENSPTLHFADLIAVCCSSDIIPSKLLTSLYRFCLNEWKLVTTLRKLFYKFDILSSGNITAFSFKKYNCMCSRGWSNLFTLNCFVPFMPRYKLIIMSVIPLFIIWTIS
jgi:phosphotransferase system  glucose/maltose/N-acetylglucosamine-specific IIC component